jgi:hypothetical protein
LLHGLCSTTPDDQSVIREAGDQCLESRSSQLLTGDAMDPVLVH